MSHFASETVAATNSGRRHRRQAGSVQPTPMWGVSHPSSIITPLTQTAMAAAEHVLVGRGAAEKAIAPRRRARSRGLVCKSPAAWPLSHSMLIPSQQAPKGADSGSARVDEHRALAASRGAAMAGWVLLEEVSRGRRRRRGRTSASLSGRRPATLQPPACRAR